MLGGGGEKTWDYGRTINLVTIRAFFQALSPGALTPEASALPQPAS